MLAGAGVAWEWSVRQAPAGEAFRSRARLEPENDGTQCLPWGLVVTAKSRKQAQAACKGNAKAHSFSASGRYTFLILSIVLVFESSAMSPDELTAQLKSEARRLGFDLAGRRRVCPATAGGLPAVAGRRFRPEKWSIFPAEPRPMAPRHVLDGARSLLMLATAYRTEEPVEPDAGRG